jgi:FkbM family methyltransferase
VPFGQNHSLRLAPDGQIAGMVWGTLFERELRDFVGRYLKSGMRVINIGANSGLYAVMASQLVGEQGTVHAVEPSTENYVRLINNLKLNNCRNVVPRKLALGDFEGSVSLRFDPKNPNLDGHFYVDKLEAGEAAPNDIEVVSCQSLDAFWKESNPTEVPPVDFVLIDVEGAELQVFKGGLSTFNLSPRMAIYFECTQKIQEINDLLKSAGFSFYEWNPEKSSLNPIGIRPGHVLALKDLPHALSLLNRINNDLGTA